MLIFIIENNLNGFLEIFICVRSIKLMDKIDFITCLFSYAIRDRNVDLY